MIDLKAFYCGRDITCSRELTDEIRRNAEYTVAKANALLERAGFAHVCTVNSGWRPRQINAATPNASATSHHLTGRAVDLPDPDRALATWCVNNLDVLGDIGLWMEDPRWTYDANGDHWVHLQTLPPRSGNRVFVPSDAPALDPDFPASYERGSADITRLMNTNQSITFFDTQFQKQVAGGDFALNPFEKVALPFVRGRVLDLGCGLGNLSIEAARRGAEVVAVDASATAIERIRNVAAAEKLNITPVLADAGSYAITGDYDTVIAIGLLMFFPREKALALLSNIQEHVAEGGLAIVNTLIEGTTFMGMFEPGHYCLFGRDELRQHFRGWKFLLDTHDGFDAPQNTRKEFSTVVAQKNNDK